MKIHTWLASLCAISAVTNVNGFAFRQSTTQQRSWIYRGNSKSELSMALTPVGPFCPFRSSATIELDPRVSQMQSEMSNGPDFAAEMARIQMEMQMGQTPDADRLESVANAIDEAVSRWEQLVTRLRISKDFQTREYAKLTDAHLQSHGVGVDSIKSMMRWQASCMRAMAFNTPPPMPPPDLDLQSIMASSQSAGDKKPPSLTAMQAAEAITASPFDPDRLESETIQAEYQKLIDDHSKTIEFGANYDDFDPLGKLAYLDEIEKIEGRWDAFFFRFKLMDAINEEYKQQCDKFLASMNLTEDDYRDLLTMGHKIMRAEAELERNQI